MLRYFHLSFGFTTLALAAAFWWGYTEGGLAMAVEAVIIAAILGVVEVSLSFDNAVVNATVLKYWDTFWRTLFLTAGIAIAVFGMRLLFPLLIVSFTSGMSLLEAWNLALENPVSYSQKLADHHHQTAAFGGMFLILVFLNYFLDEGKDTHWLHRIEKRMGLLGRIDSVAVLIALSVLLFFATLVNQDKGMEMVYAGIWGILVYLLVGAVSHFLQAEEEEDPTVSQMVRHAGLGGFLYLEVLDASFSFDGVIGAFAITRDIVLIMLGLGIGAMFIRSLTIYLVDRGVLDEYIYLEHGAHYAIGALAFIMLTSVSVHVPELVTGILSVAMIGLAFRDSIQHKRAILEEKRESSTPD